MRRILLSFGFLLATASLLSAQPATGVVGTVHDLSSTGLRKVTAAQSVCVFCHAIHGNAVTNQLIPNWNHTTTATTFQMYNSSFSQTLKGAVDAQPTGPSLACLSCHDGTVAMGALFEVPAGGGHSNYTTAQGGINPTTGRMVGANVVGPNLTGEHPISITYRDDLNTKLKAASAITGVKLYPTNATGSKVQCASCHDVHNYGVTGTTAPFLRVSMANSALCVACHKM